MSILRTFRHGFLLSMALLAVACSNAETRPETAALEIFEVHHDGRIHVFYDQKLYEDFQKLGETPYRLTRIGAGPHGETVVLGLTRKDKKMKQPVLAVEVFDGRTPAPANFYGEMQRDGRIYVFDSYREMEHVRKVGEPTYRYTMIGAGPQGETVVLVLTKQNKKQHPTALLNRFRQHHRG